MAQILTYVTKNGRTSLVRSGEPSGGTQKVKSGDISGAIQRQGGKGGEGERTQKPTFTFNGQEVANPNYSKPSGIQAGLPIDNANIDNASYDIATRTQATPYNPKPVRFDERGQPVYSNREYDLSRRTQVDVTRNINPQGQIETSVREGRALQPKPEIKKEVPQPQNQITDNAVIEPATRIQQNKKAREANIPTPSFKKGLEYASLMIASKIVKSIGKGVKDTIEGLTIKQKETGIALRETIKNPYAMGYEFGKELERKPLETVSEFAGSALLGEAIVKAPKIKTVVQNAPEKIAGTIWEAKETSKAIGSKGAEVLVNIGEAIVNTFPRGKKASIKGVSPKSLAKRSKESTGQDYNPNVFQDQGQAGVRVRNPQLKAQFTKERRVRLSQSGEVTIADKPIGGGQALATKYTQQGEVSFRTSPPEPRQSKLYPRGYGSQAVTRNAPTQEAILLVRESRRMKATESLKRTEVKKAEYYEPQYQALEAPKQQAPLTKADVFAGDVRYKEPITKYKGFGSAARYQRAQESIARMKAARAQQFNANLPAVYGERGLAYQKLANTEVANVKDIPQGLDVKRNPLTKEGKLGKIVEMESYGKDVYGDTKYGIETKEDVMPKFKAGIFQEQASELKSDLDFKQELKSETGQSNILDVSQTQKRVIKEGIAQEQKQEQKQSQDRIKIKERTIKNVTTFKIPSGQFTPNESPKEIPPTYQPPKEQKVREPNTPKFKTPENPKPKVGTIYKQERKIGLGYNVFTKKAGKLVKINVRPLNKEQAINLGQRVVGTTARASFKIEPTRERVEQVFTLKGNPKDFYINPKGFFVEKRNRRIKSVGEKREITYKGIQARRGKKTWLGF